MKPYFLSLALALGACHSAMPGPPLGSEAPAPGPDVGLGQPARLGAIVVTPLEIVEDSRCPQNVNCVWAGRVVLRVRIDGSGWREEANLRLGEAYSTHGHSITLDAVFPNRTAEKPVLPADYAFVLRLN